MPDVSIYEGEHIGGPFNRSAAINTAARLADQDGRWDLGIVIDSDVFLRRSQVRKAIERARRTGRVTWAHRRWRGLSQEHTERVLYPKSPIVFGAEFGGHDMDIYVERTNPISWSCCIVIPRKVWDEIGGFDERFVGWGFEDMAFQSVVCGLFGYERIKGDVYHLWHPRTEERIVKGLPAVTAKPEYVANGRLGRRYMYALRRDHRLTERVELPSAEELQRDLDNLQRDDHKFALLQTREERANWTDWWPTLPELVEGAKAYCEEMSHPKVTLIVHTGGEPDNWEQRKGYLRRSLASLNEQVSGPIVQRVIYSDWGEEQRAELEAIVEPLGFYVAGEGHHGYTGSMRRMWLYIAKRAKGSYIFRVEDDFIYERPVDLEPMIATLQDRPYLAQLALLRGAVYAREFELGGVLGWPAASFTQQGTISVAWLEHDHFWTNNPALFRRDLTAQAWPNGSSSERLFGDALTRDPVVRFGLWGNGEAWVSHIGEVRAGTTY